MERLIGARLGKYELRAEIGRGGMGVVYEGFDPWLERRVAIKVLAPHLAWEEEFVARFLREARAAARLRHPHIVTIHDVGTEAGWYYFVMEFLEGRPLTALLRERGRLELNEALPVLGPLAEALDYAHCRGVVHRDVKPANVVIGPDGRVTLTDFGIARAGEGTGVTRSGLLLGTPAYMSPEQALGQPVDARSDQYALGVLAYEMLVGQVPFHDESTPVVLRQVAFDPPPPAQLLCPGLPVGAARALERVLEKSPTARYEDCEQFVQALALPESSAAPGRASPLSPGEGAPTRMPAVSLSTATVSPRPQPMRLWRVWAAIAFTALVCGTLLFGALGGWRRVDWIAAVARPTPVPTRPPQPTAAPTATATRYPQPSKAIDAANAARLEMLARIADIGPVRAVAFSADGDLLAAAAPLGIALYDAQTLQVAQVIGKDTWVESLAFSHAGQILASGWEDGVVLLWNAADGHTRGIMEEHRDDVLSVALSPDGALVASGSEDTTVRLSRVADGTRVSILEGHTADVQSVAFSPDGTMLASAGDDGTIRLWAIPSGAPLRTLEGHGGRVWCVAFSPDGSLLASGSDDRSVRLWRSTDWTVAHALTGHTLDVVSIAFSPDGALLASGDYVGSVRLWRVDDGALLRVLEGLNGRVYSLAFSPDGKILAIGCTDGSVSLWGVAE